MLLERTSLFCCTTRRFDFTTAFDTVDLALHHHHHHHLRRRPEEDFLVVRHQKRFGEHRPLAADRPLVQRLLWAPVLWQARRKVRRWRRLRCARKLRQPPGKTSYRSKRESNGKENPVHWSIRNGWCYSWKRKLCSCRTGHTWSHRGQGQSSNTIFTGMDRNYYLGYIMHVWFDFDMIFLTLMCWVLP